MSCPYDSVCGEFFLCMHFYLWIIMLSDLSFSRGIDVFCRFFHLQVGIRCERLLDTVTVKCGHCSNLSFLSTRPLLQGQCLHHLSPLFVLVTLWTMDRGTGPSQPGDPMKKNSKVLKSYKGLKEIIFILRRITRIFFFSIFYSFFFFLNTKHFLLTHHLNWCAWVDFSPCHHNDWWQRFHFNSWLSS